MARSHISLQNRAFAIDVEVTSLKGVRSMRLHRDLGISQKAAWFMLHRIRETWRTDLPTFVGPVGKTAVAGTKARKTDEIRAHMVERTDSATLQTFVLDHTKSGAKVYTDEAKAYKSLPNHEMVKHSVGEYVRLMAHTNGVESFWAVLKRGCHGTFHHMSVKHLQRYVNAFAGRHNIWTLDTHDQMVAVAAGFIGERLMYRDLGASFYRRGATRRFYFIAGSRGFDSWLNSSQCPRSGQDASGNGSHAVLVIVE